MPRSLINYNQLNPDVTSNIVAVMDQNIINNIKPVLQTGDQTISGNKNFVNGLFLSGYMVVATSGGQIIGGIKKFSSDIYAGLIYAIGGFSYIDLNNSIIYDNTAQPSINYTNHQLTGTWHFQNSPTFSGANFVVTTGGQVIGGNKYFSDTVVINDGIITKNGTGMYAFFDYGDYIIYNYQNNNYINWENGEIGNHFNPSLNFQQNQISGDWFTNSNPTSPLSIVNKNYVDNGISNVVRTSGQQTITGQKLFASGIRVDYIDPYSVNGAPIVAPRVYLVAGATSATATGQLRSNSTSVSLDWLNKILSGNWSTNTTPSQSGHIVNKGYLDSNPTLNNGLNVLGNVGIGTTTPGAKTVIRSSYAAYGMCQIINENTDGEASIGYRDDSDTDVNSWVVGKNLGGVTNDSFGWYYGVTKMTLTNNGELGIGTTSPSAQLHTTSTVRFANFGAGTATFDANGNISSSSDERLKDIKGDFNRGIESITGINPIIYKWGENSGMETSGTYLGFSAQNVNDFIPEAVSSGNNGYLTLSDRGIIAVLVNSVKELMVKNQQLEERIRLLEG